jgi:Fe-S oxidoreductase
MRVLPVLEGRRHELETCVFCPKLCRSACPVSNAEPRETLTPWGKMSLAWMVAQGDVPDGRSPALPEPGRDLEFSSYAAPAWACTGCLACREHCDHKNPVATVLLEARDALARMGSAPPGASRVLAGFTRHAARTQARTRALAAGLARSRGSSSDALLVGCAYVRGAPREARDAVEATSALLGEPVALVEGCCGLPLRLAGDRAAFATHARSFARLVEGKRRLVVVDAGCAHTLLRRYAEEGVKHAPRVETFDELAANARDAFSRAAPSPTAPVRWSDPCQLGRGLGIYDQPRAVLERVFGEAPDEMETSREQATCSGAGGLLPATMPETAAEIARTRAAEHARLGGGLLVTGCAGSLRALRKAVGAEGDRVVDIVSVVAKALA